MSTTDDLIKGIHDQLKALDSRMAEDTSEARLIAVCTPIIEGLLGDDEFVRKMRFGQQADNSVALTKYARFGFTVADVELLYDLQRSLLGQKRVENPGVYDGPSPDLEKAFAAVSGAHYLTMEQTRAIDRKAIDDMFPRVNKQNVAQYEAALRAMDTAESGYGSQLIGAQYVADLWDGARPDSKLFALIETFEMTAPTVYLPVAGAYPELYFVSESTAHDASNFTTVKTGSNRVSVAAKKFVIHQMWSGEMEEDSIVPFIPYLRRQAQGSLAKYSDSLVMNGDTTNASTNNINLVDADPADTKHYLAFDGIRHAALVDNTGNMASAAGGVPTWNDLIGMRSLLIDRTYDMDWGHPAVPTDLVYVVAPELGDQLVQELDELVTVDKYGPGATVLTGEITRVGRNPLITSIVIAKSDTAGKVSDTTGNNLYGEIVLFNRNGLVVGWRRRVKLETERIPATDQTRLVYSLRMGLGRFTPTGSASGMEWAADRYYVAL